MGNCYNCSTVDSVDSPPAQNLSPIIQNPPQHSNQNFTKSNNGIDYISIIPSEVQVILLTCCNTQVLLSLTCCSKLLNYLCNRVVIWQTVFSRERGKFTLVRTTDPLSLPTNDLESIIYYKILSKNTVKTYVDLSLAIKEAKVNYTIVIAPGQYEINTTCEINKTLHIVGDSESPSEVVLYISKNTVSSRVFEFLHSSGSTLRNISIQNENVVTHGWAISLISSKLSLENCSLKSTGYSAAVVDRISVVNAKSCTFSSSGESGITFFDSNGSLTDCTMVGCPHTGVLIYSSKVTLKRCKIFDNENGVLATTNPYTPNSTESVLIIDSCEIYDNKGTGVKVEKNSEITCMNSKIYRSCACLLLGNCRAAIVNNEIYDALESTIFLTYVVGTFKNNKIHNSRQNLIYVCDHSRLELKENHLYNSKLSMIVIMTSKEMFTENDDNNIAVTNVENNTCNFILIKNKIENGKDCGICLIGSRSGQFLIEENEISDIQRDGIVIKQENSNIKIRGNNFNNNGNPLKIWTKDEINTETKIPNNVILDSNNISEQDVKFWKWHKLDPSNLEQLSENVINKFDKEVLTALVHNLCTRSVTKQQFYKQPVYECLTCDLKGDYGVCYVCATNCHNGHQIQTETIADFYCDCGSKGVNCNCYNEEF